MDITAAARRPRSGCWQNWPTSPAAIRNWPTALRVTPNFAPTRISPSGLAALAARQAEHARTLHALLRERNVWSKLPRPMEAEGSSNWARVSGDLEIMLELSREVNQQALHWEGIDPALAARLRTIALRGRSQSRRTARAGAEVRSAGARLNSQVYRGGSQSGLASINTAANSAGSVPRLTHP